MKTEFEKNNIKIFVDENLVYKRNNLKAWRDLIFRLVYHITFVSVSTIFFLKHNYLMAVLFAIPHLMTFSFFGAAGLSHELFHNTVFSNRKLNRFLYVSFMVLTWENYGYFDLTHWKHHKETLLENDPKSLFKGKINYWYLIRLFTFDLKGFKTKITYIVKNAFGHIPNSKSSYLFPDGSSSKKNVVLGARIILLFHLLLALVFLFSGKWWLIFLINLGPFFISFFNRILGFAQHYGLSAEDCRDYISNCRTITLSKFWSFFYSNMNYHIEHHMFPSVPYYNIEKVHEELKNDCDFKNLSVGWVGLLSDLRKKGIFLL
jgi:fatty acid desaturase